MRSPLLKERRRKYNWDSAFYYCQALYWAKCRKNWIVRLQFGLFLLSCVLITDRSTIDFPLLCFYLCYSGKPKPEIHVSMATPVPVSMEAVCNQGGEQPSITVPPTSQQPPSAIPTIIAAASPTSQPAAALSTIPGAVAAAPPTSTTIVAAPAPPSTMSGALSAVLGPVVPEIKIKEEMEPMDIMRPVSGRWLGTVRLLLLFLRHWRN